MLTPYDKRTTVFDMASVAASYTHGHPTGQAASGAFALIIATLVDGRDLDGALDVTLWYLASVPGGDETRVALEAARAAAKRGDPSARVVESLGGGWVAEEALAIAVYCALAYPGPEQMLDALALAVTHSGDSDSTGAICGNIVGAWHGEEALPPELAFEVEGRGTVLQLADDFVYEMTARDRLHGGYGPHTRWTDRYPGW
jgi:ADP-ribosylglycohydrolase